MANPPPDPPPRGLGRDILTLTKPGITALIVLVAVAGYFLALPARIDLVRLGILVGAGGMASAGAAMLNHYLDRDLDAKMRRTRHRPIPDARIESSGTVAVGGLALSALGVGLAAWLLNPLTGFSILLGGLTYVLVYTIWLKRRSSWNIVVGGFAGSAPALAGGAAAVGHWTPGVLVFALLVFLWTPPHFWSLALLLRSDYAAVGLPMLPRMDDPAYSGKVVVVSAALLVPPSAALALTGAVAWPVTAAVVVLGLVFVVLAAPLWRDPTRAVARRGFLYSGPYLIAVVVALIVNSWLIGIGVPIGW
jgi:protoheme IX farnesyltransferase